jgi:hypothetical protein
MLQGFLGTANQRCLLYVDILGGLPTSVGRPHHCSDVGITVIQRGIQPPSCLDVIAMSLHARRGYPTCPPGVRGQYAALAQCQWGILHLLLQLWWNLCLRTARCGASGMLHFIHGTCTAQAKVCAHIQPRCPHAIQAHCPHARGNTSHGHPGTTVIFWIRLLNRTPVATYP